MQQIDQVSQDTAKLSICRTVHTSVCVCARLCGFCAGRVKTSVVCLGRRMQESIAGSEGNVSLSAESIHSHQTGSLSIMRELREHTLSFSSVCLFASAGPVSDGITIARVRALGMETVGDVGKQRDREGQERINGNINGMGVIEEVGWNWQILCEWHLSV